MSSFAPRARRGNVQRHVATAARARPAGRASARRAMDARHRTRSDVVTAVLNLTRNGAPARGRAGLEATPYVGSSSERRRGAADMSPVRESWTLSSAVAVPRLPHEYSTVRVSRIVAFARTPEVVGMTISGPSHGGPRPVPKWVGKNPHRSVSAQSSTRHASRRTKRMTNRPGSARPYTSKSNVLTSAVHPPEGVQERGEGLTPRPTPQTDPSRATPRFSFTSQGDVHDLRSGAVHSKRISLCREPVHAPARARTLSPAREEIASTPTTMDAPNNIGRWSFVRSSPTATQSRARTRAQQGGATGVARAARSGTGTARAHALRCVADHIGVARCRRFRRHRDPRPRCFPTPSRE